MHYIDRRPVEFWLKQIEAKVTEGGPRRKRRPGDMHLGITLHIADFLELLSKYAKELEIKLAFDRDVTDTDNWLVVILGNTRRDVLKKKKGRLRVFDVNRTWHQGVIADDVKEFRKLFGLNSDRSFFARPTDVV